MQAGCRGGTHTLTAVLSAFGHQLEAAAAAALVHLCHPGKKKFAPKAKFLKLDVAE